MKACGLIVEYNPFHNGHAYHIEEARKATGADCIVAVMSGSFLQRGEPAIIDKFHRTKAALQSGIDLMLELPYVYAVQNSDLFAEGAVRTLHEAGVTSICFGSESGEIADFLESYDIHEQKKPIYEQTLKEFLAQGYSFPEASRHAYGSIGLTTDKMDLSRPNNILGYSYVKTILSGGLSIEPITIRRTNNDFHDESINGSIASATSIRKRLLDTGGISEDSGNALPAPSIEQLEHYSASATVWHHWESYFPLLRYRVLTMSLEQLRQIEGVDEGLEHRIKKTASEVHSFSSWVHAVKSKRYTWTRLQRIFVHLLTNTSRHQHPLFPNGSVPYVRILGMNQKGQEYLNGQKKRMQVPLVSRLSRKPDHPFLETEERATRAYYSILPAELQNSHFKEEINLPILLHAQ